MSRTNSITDFIQHLIAKGDHMGNELAQLESWFENVPPADEKKGGFTEVADGKHIAKIVDAGIFTGGKSPALSFNFYFPHANRREFAYFNLGGGDVPRRILQNTLDKLGLKPQTIHAIDSEAKKTVGWTVEVTKKTKGAYKNYYIERVVERTAPDTKGENLTEDQIPF